MMNNRQCYFDRETTNLVKSILLILMFVLHLFCFPSWYVDGIEYPHLTWLENYQGHFQICIAGFTFLTGYLYFFTKHKSFNYVVKKWKDILFPYWLVYFIFLIIGLLTNTYSYNFKAIVLELIALDRPIMFFCWYVSYYIIMIGTLWLLVKLIKSDIVKWISALVGSFILYCGIAQFVHVDFLVSTAEKFSIYFPITATGYIFAKRKWFEKIKEYVGKKNTICSVLFIIIVFMEPSWLYEIEINNIMFELIRKCIRIISISIFMYGVIEITMKIHNQIVRSILSDIGKHSMIMWFVHSYFLIVARKFFKDGYIFQRIQ